VRRVHPHGEPGPAFPASQAGEADRRPKQADGEDRKGQLTRIEGHRDQEVTHRQTIFLIIAVGLLLLTYRKYNPSR
jgi:hypothetical protein